jgi:hypothetical protein
MCAVVKKQPGESKTVFFNIRLAPAMHAALVKLARENERTVAGEIRAALKQHLNGREQRHD